MDPFDLRLWKGFASAGGDMDAPALTDQITIDSQRIASKHALFVPLKGMTEDGHSFIPQASKVGARYALVRYGWSTHEDLKNLKLLYVEDPLRAFQEIAGTYRRQKKCQVVAIAGSYGKTMVKDLLENMLLSTHTVVASPESFNSQIGVPLSLLTITDNHTVALIEVGISHKEEMDILSEMICADFSIITHIGKKHIVTLRDLDTIAHEMLKIVKLPPEKHWAIIPKDPHILKQLKEPRPHHHFWNDYNPELPHSIFTSQEHGSRMPYRVDFPDGNTHFGLITSGFNYFVDLMNITVKAAWLLGGNSSCISETLKNYTPEPMRTEIWKSADGATFINDTYCSDPQSVDAALRRMLSESQNHRKVFVFGGMRGKNIREIEYRRIGKAIHRARIDLLVVYGPHPFDPLIDEVTKLSPDTEIIKCSSYKEALTLLQGRIKKNDLVLVKGEHKQSLDSIAEAFNDSICSNQCIINLAAIAENLTRLRNKLPKKTRVMVMVKALAYGTDEVRMAKFLESANVDILGVSYVDEGVALRRASAKQSIFVINAAIYEAAKVVKWGLEIGVSEPSLIEAVANEASRQNKVIKVHLHVDTGMGRFGCRPEVAISLAKLVQDCPHLELEGVMTHFACADNPAQDEFTLLQAKRFDAVIEELKVHGIHPKWCHAANSSACVRFDFPPVQHGAPRPCCLWSLLVSSCFRSSGAPACPFAPLSHCRHQHVQMRRYHKLWTPLSRRKRKPEYRGSTYWLLRRAP